MFSAGVRQFRTGAALSYVLFDRESKRAMLIDPSVDLLNDYRSFIAEHDLLLGLIVDTRLHVDHFSASHLLHGEYGAEVAMSATTASERPTRKLADEEEVRVGSLRLRAILTPGHAADAMVLLLESTPRSILFSGDTLIFGGMGKCECPEAKPEVQWTSLGKLVAVCEDRTLVFPGRDYVGRLFSTIGNERAKNPAFRYQSAASFAESKQKELAGHLSEDSMKRRVFNQSANPDHDAIGVFGGVVISSGYTGHGDEDVYTTISVDKYMNKIEESKDDVLFLDVRERSEFEAGHIARHRQVPLAELFEHLDEFSKASRIYVCCSAAWRSALVARTLGYLGYPYVVALNGGIKAWMQAGYPLDK